jgi:hypothetical protein
MRRDVAAASQLSMVSETIFRERVAIIVDDVQQKILSHSSSSAASFTSARRRARARGSRATGPAANGESRQRAPRRARRAIVARARGRSF